MTGSMKKRIDVRTAGCKQLLDKFATLENGFDGEGSIAPSRRCIDLARHIIRLWPSDLPLPQLDVDLEGDIIIDVMDIERGILTGFDIDNTNSSVSWFISATGRTKIQDMLDADEQEAVTSVLRKMADEFTS